MKTEITKFSPNLMVRNIKKSLKFYTELLGFELKMAVPENKQEIAETIEDDRQYIYALVAAGNIEIMFQIKESLKEDIPALNVGTPNASITFYFEVTNINNVYALLKDKTEMVKDLHTTWYGMQEFYIKDPDGYILGLAQGA